MALHKRIIYSPLRRVRALCFEYIPDALRPETTNEGGREKNMKTFVDTVKSVACAVWHTLTALATIDWTIKFIAKIV